MTVGDNSPNAILGIRAAIEARQWHAARAACHQLVTAEPTSYAGWVCLAAIESEAGDIEACAGAFARAAAIRPDDPLAWRALGDARHRQGRLIEAVAAYEAAIAAAPLDPYPHVQLGVVLAALGRRGEARRSYERALSLRPDAPDVLVNLGNLDLADGCPERAVTRLTRARSLAPDMPEAVFNLGNALKALGRLEEARSAYARAVTLKPGFARAHVNLGATLLALGRQQEALPALQTAIAMDPADADAHNNLGVTCLGLARLEDALTNFDRAIALRPDFREALRNRAALRIRLNRHADALADCNLSLTLEPDRSDVHLNRAVALHALQRLEEALAASDRSISLRSDCADAYSNRALTLAALGRATPAIADLRRALQLRPDFATAWNNLGHVLQESGRLGEAIDAYARARTADPALDYVIGNLSHARGLDCQWHQFGADRRDGIRRTRRGGRGLPPFASLALSVSSRTQARAALSWRETEIVASPPPLPPHPREPGRKWRIAYLSADFRAHAMSSLMIDVFRNHDRSRFEIAAFSFSRAAADAISAALEPQFDTFVDVAGMSDPDAVAVVRRWKPDVAVDLMGPTRGSRPNLFARRMAPVQAAFLGFPGPIGCDFIDYTIADAIVVPAHDRAAFNEAIAFLPHSYYPTSYRAQATASPLPPSRTELGLPDNAFVFVCFNNSYKFNPPVFDAWMRILKQVERGVLWLLLESEPARNRLRAHASASGIDPTRLHFVSRVPWDVHLRRLAAADLFLDTWPYNAHTTAADALWAGVPVLTKRGRTFAGRVAESLLTAVGLPHLVAETLSAYEQRAVDLAGDPTACARLRKHLAAARITAPLFDSARFASDLETGYIAMAARRLAGLPATDIRISASSPIAIGVVGCGNPVRNG